MRSSRWSSETGSTLLITLLVMMVVSSLVAAVVTSATTDTVVARNHESAAQAQAAAEAGLNHATDVARTYLRNWEANFSNTNDAVNRLLRGPDDTTGGAADADNGSLTWLPGGTPTPPATLPLAGLAGVRYQARIFDDDDPALGNNWTAADLARVTAGGTVGEGTAGVADPVVDHNGVFVIRATGFARDNTMVTVEAVMKPCPWPAIITNGNLNMNGGPQILGTGGSVHANGNITEVGNAAVVEHDVTAVGTVTTNNNWTPVQGVAEGGQLPIPIPSVNVSDYLPLANYKLGSDGQISYRAQSTDPWTVLCATNAACSTFGFSWTSQASSQASHMAGITRTWDPGGTPNCTVVNASLASRGIPQNCGQGVYYAEGSDVIISGNLGRPQGSNPSPYALTLLAEGSIKITGTPQLKPALARPYLVFVTNGDLVMSGTSNCDIMGQSRVREQFEFGGTMSLAGQVIVENRWQLSDLVTGDSKVYGNATVTNNRLAVYDYALAGWREWRQ